jgi:UrcA family protein
MLKAISALGAIAVAAVLLIPTASIASPASATDDAEHVSATVYYADLNLAHASGAYALKRRVNYAAETLCGTPASLELQFNTVSRRCISGAVASAQPAVDAALAAARRGTVTVTYGAALTLTAPRQ